MAIRIVLREIEAIQPSGPGNYWPTLARCEFCYEDVAEDFRNHTEPRRFYELVGEDLTVCENCIGDID